MEPRVRASPASLRCFLEQDTGSTQKDQPYIAVSLLMGRKESNQTKKLRHFYLLVFGIHLYIYNLGLLLDIFQLPRTLVFVRCSTP